MTKEEEVSHNVVIGLAVILIICPFEPNLFYYVPRILNVLFLIGILIQIIKSFMTGTKNNVLNYLIIFMVMWLLKKSHTTWILTYFPTVLGLFLLVNVYGTKDAVEVKKSDDIERLVFDNVLILEIATTDKDVSYNIKNLTCQNETYNKDNIEKLSIAMSSCLSTIKERVIKDPKANRITFEN